MTLKASTDVCKIVVNLGKSMYCKSNDISSCRDGVHCITTSGKSCDGLLLGLPDEWAIQCAMRMEHQFEGIWSHPSNLCVSRKRQCECVTVCYWNILNSFETSKKWDMLFPASLFTEAYWKGPRFHPSTFVVRIPRTSTAWHHIPVLSCSARLTRSRPDATDGRCCETIFPGKAWHFETWSFSYFSCNSEALLNIHEYPGDFKILLMLNVQKLNPWTRPTSTPWSLMLLLARMARTMTTRCSTWNGNWLSMMSSLAKFRKAVFRFNEALILSYFIDYIYII